MGALGKAAGILDAPGCMKSTLIVLLSMLTLVHLLCFWEKTCHPMWYRCTSVPFERAEVLVFLKALENRFLKGHHWLHELLFPENAQRAIDAHKKMG